jgi:hypothetical protein
VLLRDKRDVFRRERKITNRRAVDEWSEHLRLEPESLRNALGQYIDLIEPAPSSPMNARHEVLKTHSALFEELPELHHITRS